MTKKIVNPLTVRRVKKKTEPKMIDLNDLVPMKDMNGTQLKDINGIPSSVSGVPFMFTSPEFKRTPEEELKICQEEINRLKIELRIWKEAFETLVRVQTVSRI